MVCASDEIETKTTEKFDTGSVVGVSIASVIVVALIITFLVFHFKKKNTLYSKYTTIFDRLGGFFGGSIGQFSIGMLVAILVADVVGSFNGLVITPLVQVAFPKQEIFRQGINIGGDRNVMFFPGQFLLSLFGFVLSLLILFFLIEGIYQLSKLPKMSKIAKYIFMTLIILLLLGLVVWNIYDVATLETRTTCTPVPNKCEGCQVFPEGTTVVAKDPEPTQQILAPITPLKSFIDPGGEGVYFGI